MRHAFRFPIAVQEAVRGHVRQAIERIRPESYRQEHSYSAALAGKLDGIVYEGEEGYVEFRSTVADDRGRGSAESWAGIDFVITASIRDEMQEIDKAIIFQAKKGLVENLPPGETDRLRRQVELMKRLTRSPKILEVPDGVTTRYPTVVSANRFQSSLLFRHLYLEDYFVQRVLTTLDGDTRPSFVDSVEESSFAALKITASIRSRPRNFR